MERLTSLFSASISFRLFKTNIKLHWSLVLLLLFYTLPHLLSGDRVKAIEGIIVLFTVMPLVLIHEFGHTFAARYYGYPVDNIHLHFFGGVAEATKKWTTPKHLFIIAFAGPATNLIFAIVGALITDFSNTPDKNFIIGNYPLFFTMVNAILFVFNMIPMSPMDGGHLLNSAIWKYTKSIDIAEFYSSIITLIIVAVMIPVFFYLHSYLTLVIMCALVFVNFFNIKKKYKIIKLLKSIKTKLKNSPTVSDVKVKHIHTGDDNYIRVTFKDMNANGMCEINFVKNKPA